MGNIPNRTQRTVVVTGAAGTIGTAVVEHAVGLGYRVVAVDQRPVDVDGVVASVIGDLKDQATIDQAFNVAHGAGNGNTALLHLAAIPTPVQFSDHETLVRNTATAHQVIAAAAHKVKRIVAVSSFSAFGFPWADRELVPDYFPIDEQHPDLAVDTYGLSKVFLEHIAAYASRRWGIPTVCLRFPLVGSGQRLEERLSAVQENPQSTSQEMWTWLGTYDAARSVIAAAEAATLGALVLNIAAPDTSSDIPTQDLLGRYFPGVEVRKPLGTFEGLISTELAKKHLGFTKYTTWRR